MERAAAEELAALFLQGNIAGDQTDNVRSLTHLAYDIFRIIHRLPPFLGYWVLFCNPLALLQESLRILCFMVWYRTAALNYTILNITSLSLFDIK